MTSLQLSFDARDASGRGSVFVYKAPSAKGKKTPPAIYIRARVENTSLADAGLARLFLARLERIDSKGNKKLLSADSFPLNWALTSGADVHFPAGYGHYADILSFPQGAKTFALMSTRPHGYLKADLGAPGIYRFHLLLTGALIKPTEAILELRWPMKKLSSENFSFSKAK